MILQSIRWERTDVSDDGRTLTLRNPILPGEFSEAAPTFRIYEPGTVWEVAGAEAVEHPDAVEITLWARKADQERARDAVVSLATPLGSRPVLDKLRHQALVRPTEPPLGAALKPVPFTSAELWGGEFLVLHWTAMDDLVFSAVNVSRDSKAGQATITIMCWSSGWVSTDFDQVTVVRAPELAGLRLIDGAAAPLSRAR